jgi:hypothetical protein
MMGNFGNPFDSGKATHTPTAQIKLPLLDGTFCRNIVFDNTTSHSIEDKVERCDGAPNAASPPSPPSGNRRTQFSWGGR